MGRSLGCKTAWLIVLLLVIFSNPSSLDSHPVGIQKTAYFKANRFKSLSSRYLIFLPPGYGEKRHLWPMIVFLHGGSARGRDINRLRNYVLPGYLQRGFYPMEEFPFIVISPQYAPGTTWRENAQAVHLLLNEVCRELAVDTERIYLTGPSMGGEGTWFIASRFRGRFAAIAPVAAVRMTPEWIEGVKGTPVWAFAGKRDRCAPFKSVMKSMRIIRREGRFKITIYDKGHIRTIHSAYQNRELYVWFLKHRLKRSEVVRTDQNEPVLKKEVKKSCKKIKFNINAPNLLGMPESPFDVISNKRSGKTSRAASSLGRAVDS